MKKRNIKKSKRISLGFTLLELVVVVLTASVLAAVSVPAYQEYVNRAKMAEGYASLSAIQRAQITHFNQFGYFAPWGANTEPDGCGCITVGGGKHMLKAGSVRSINPFPNPSMNYFTLETRAFGWDKDNNGFVVTDINGEPSAVPGTPEVTINLGFKVSDRNSIVGDCRSGFSAQGMGVVQAPNTQFAMTWGGVNFKGDPNRCTFLIQLMEATPNKPVSRPVIVVQE